MSAKRRHTHDSCRKVQAPRLGSDLQLTRVLFGLEKVNIARAKAEQAAAARYSTEVCVGEEAAPGGQGLAGVSVCLLLTFTSNPQF